MNKKIFGYQFGDFYLDVSDEKNIKLFFKKDYQISTVHNKDLELLELLIQNSPNLVEKDIIYKRFFPTSHTPEDLTRHSIERLRKAISDKTIIQTVHRQGYKFAASAKEINSETKLPDDTLTTGDLSEETEILDLQNEEIDLSAEILEPFSENDFEKFQPGADIQTHQVQTVKIIPNETSVWKTRFFILMFYSLIVTGILCLIAFNRKIEEETIIQVKKANISLDLRGWSENPSRAEIIFDYGTVKLSKNGVFLQRLETKFDETPELQMLTEDLKALRPNVIPATKEESCSSNGFAWKYILDLSHKESKKEFPLAFKFLVNDTFPDPKEWFTYYVPRSTDILEIKIIFPPEKPIIGMPTVHEVKGCAGEAGTPIPLNNENFRVNTVEGSITFTMKSPRTDFSYKIDWNW